MKLVTQEHADIMKALSDLRASVDTYVKALAGLSQQHIAEWNRAEAALAEVERLKAQPIAVTVKPLKWNLVNTHSGEQWSCREVEYRIPANWAPKFVDKEKDKHQKAHEAKVMELIAARTEDEVRQEAIGAAAKVYLNGSGPDTWDFFDTAHGAILALANPTKGEAK